MVSRISIIIPAYNEESSIGLVLDALPQEKIHEIIVVDNCSTDATARVAQEHDFPEEIFLLIGPIENGEKDFVLGSRMIFPKSQLALLPQARYGNRLAILLIKLFFKYEFTDLGPFRAIRYSSLMSLGMQDRDFGWTVEMQIKAVRNGLRIHEVPVNYRKRVGISKITGTLSGTIRAGTKIIYTIFKYLLP